MPKTLFEFIGGMDEEYGTSGKEAQELGNKVWLSGGRVIRNTRTWYAHLRFNRTYSLPNGEREKSKRRAIDIWTGDLWPGQVRPFQWLIDKFNPPGWTVKKEGEKVGRSEDKEIEQNDIDNNLKNSSIFDLAVESFGADLTKSSPIKIRKFKRRHLTMLFRKLGYTSGAEVGVAWGRFSEVMCEHIPNLELLCVDPWQPQDDDPRHRKNHDENYAEASRRLKSYNAKLMRMRSMDAVLTVPDESLDFVYIDANHVFEAARDDIAEWSKKVKPGGIVSGHDYYRFRNAGVIEAVDKYVEINGIQQWFLTDEKAKSWFWVKT
jgi:predicted O-methyltransferase YrrM